MDSAALLTHIVSQTRQNVEFLISQNQISPDNGRDILLKLPSSPISPSSNASIDSLARQTQNLTVQAPSLSSTATAVTSSAPNPIVDPPHTSQQTQPPTHTGPTALFQAKAMWNYNEHGQVSFTLSYLLISNILGSVLHRARVTFRSSQEKRSISSQKPMPIGGPVTTKESKASFPLTMSRRYPRQPCSPLLLTLPTLKRYREGRTRPTHRRVGIRDPRRPHNRDMPRMALVPRCIQRLIQIRNRRRRVSLEVVDSKTLYVLQTYLPPPC